MKYHLARGEEQLGTFNDLDVSAGLRSGRFLPSDLCWTEGMKEWQTLESRMKDLAADAGEEAPAASAAVTMAALREEVRRDREDESRQLASLGQRFAASVIDFFFAFGGLVAILSVAASDAKFQEQLARVQDDPQAASDLLMRHFNEAITSANPDLGLVIMILLMIGLSVATIVLLAVRGQTLGKLMVGIQIVRNEDERRAGFVKAVLLRTLLFGIIGRMPLVGPVFLIADVLLIFRQDRRCLHDLVADTKVIRRQARS